MCEITGGIPLRSVKSNQLCSDWDLLQCVCILRDLFVYTCVCVCVCANNRINVSVVETLSVIRFSRMEGFAITLFSVRVV